MRISFKSWIILFNTSIQTAQKVSLILTWCMRWFGCGMLTSFLHLNGGRYGFQRQPSELKPSFPLYLHATASIHYNGGSSSQKLQVLSELNESGLVMLCFLKNMDGMMEIKLSYYTPNRSNHRSGRDY